MGVDDILYPFAKLSFAGREFNQCFVFLLSFLVYVFGTNALPSAHNPSGQYSKGVPKVLLPSMTITHRLPGTPPLAFFYATMAVDLHVITCLVHVLASRLVAF